jgi:hypothetical protein
MGLAMDAKTRQGLAVPRGDRRPKRAPPVGATIPSGSRAPATFETDQSVVETNVMPAVQHRARTTLARTTHPLERFHPP